MVLAGVGRLGVQGVERAERKLLDAAALVGHLVPEGSMFAFLATHRGEVFPDEEFADLFPSGRGRPSLPAPVAAAVLTLQTLHDLSDAVATQDTITQLIAAIRRVGREVPGAAATIAVVCTGHDYAKPGKPQIDWEDPQAKDALVSALVNDASALVAALDDAELDEQAQGAVALS